MRLIDIGPWAEAHHGLVSRAALDLDRDRWKRAIAAGTLEPVHPGVARIPGTARTREQAIMAAVLAAGPGAMASHRSAAALWGIERPRSDPIDIIVPGRRRFPRPADVVVHRPTDAGRLNPQRPLKIPSTNIVRTLLDLGAVDPSGVGAAVHSALGDRLAHLNALHLAVLEHARPGRSGIRALRAAVLDASLDHKPVDSVLEPAMRGLAERFRLPRMEFHPRIEGWEVDFRVVDTALILECDGWSSHGLDREQFERDRIRDDDLRAAGWIVMRFTYRAIVQRASDTARRIRRAVDRWGPLPVPY